MFDFMKKILIAYDGSPGAEMAIKDLTRAGLRQCAEARVLTIADVWLPPPPVDSENLFPDHPSIAKAHEKAAEVLRNARKTAIQGAQLVHQVCPDWKINNCAKADSPAWGILAEATRWQADLIVIGSHGRTPLEKFFLGSVSHKVAAEARCSVRVVRPRKHSNSQSMHILIGLDGSEDSRQAADEVLQRHWGAGTEVELVAVLDERLRSGVLANAGLFEDTIAINGIEDTVVSLLLEKTRAELASHEIKAQCHFFEGDPKNTLLRCAADWNVDCIFLGARGRDHGDRLYLGTLASAVCARAHCTVEIVRPPHQAKTS
jgi:nucleotide-binding universal stress UspA family protein